MLEDNIQENLYGSVGRIPTNFNKQSPKEQSELVLQTLKDPYNLSFLQLSKGYNETELENALATNITRFLLELGHGFAYVGRQMELRMPGGQSFFPDMVFYNIPLKCYVVIELKVVKFVPEFAGKLNFYVTAADHLLRGKATIRASGCSFAAQRMTPWWNGRCKTSTSLSEYLLINCKKW